MEQVVHPITWADALAAVQRNAGAPGPDGMDTAQLEHHLHAHGETIRKRLLEGCYKPAPVRRVQIPKPDGGQRTLGIPNALDRFIQQLLLLTLAPEFEPHFSKHSHGFIKGRSPHTAIAEAKQHAQAGKDWLVDMDITKFFDHVNHDILMRQIAARIRDKRILRLIGNYLRAGAVLSDGLLVQTEEGTPQGGPLSPLLANIYLDKLDKELEKRGHAFVRYADDCNIHVASERAAQNALARLTTWTRKHLRLEVNAKKSGTGRPWTRKFLGFILTTTLLTTIAPQSLGRFEDKVRQHWNGRQPLTSNQLRDNWAKYLRGWWGYYRHCEDPTPIKRKEGWIRRHMRKCYWQRWHSTKGRQKNIRKLGGSEELIRMGASSKGAWRIAGSQVMQKTLTNRVLRRYGHVVPTDLT
jgi:group II intron reverse transcriptase/maturase